VALPQVVPRQAPGGGVKVAAPDVLSWSFFYQIVRVWR